MLLISKAEADKPSKNLSSFQALGAFCKLHNDSAVQAGKMSTNQAEIESRQEMELQPLNSVNAEEAVVENVENDDNEQVRIFN